MRWFWTERAGTRREHLDGQGIVRGRRRRGSRLIALLAAAILAAAAPGTAGAQESLETVCSRPGTAAPGECRLAAGAAELIHPRIGLALWGGAPVPGSASTLGMRIGSFPRLDVSGRLTLVPVEAPPITDRLEEEGDRGLITALSGQATVGLLTGWSPLPTVGGVLSLDGILRASWARLPTGVGFEDGGVLGVSAGLRLGALRESFTLPGVSLTASYGRSTEVDFGDPDGPGDGYVSGAIGNWNATLAATKRIGPVGLSAGASLDRYTSDVEFGYVSVPGAALITGTADGELDRWSVFANASWSFLIAHASLELGWQDAPAPGGIPVGVALDPAHLWLGAALRLSI